MLIPLPPGLNKVWDLSGVKNVKTFKMVFESRSKCDDTIGCVIGRTRYVFSESGDTLKYVGFENNLSDMWADRPEHSMIFPAQFNSSFGGEYNGSGRYTDRLNQDMKASYFTCVDACGDLITMDCDTIRNVMRLRTVKVISDLYMPISINDSQSQKDSLSLREVTSRLYAPGYRYPLLISRDVRSWDDGRLLLSTAYSISLSEMESLDDPVNEELRKKPQDVDGDREYHAIENQSKDPGSLPIDYSLLQDRSAGTITINFTMAEDADVTFIMADIHGIVYYLETIKAYAGENRKISFDYGKLPYSAAYGINIAVGQEIFSEKIFR